MASASARWVVFGQSSGKRAGAIIMMGDCVDWQLLLPHVICHLLTTGRHADRVVAADVLETLEWVPLVRLLPLLPQHIRLQPCGAMAARACQ